MRYRQVLTAAFLVGMLAACNQSTIDSAVVHARTVTVTPVEGFALFGNIPNATWLESEQQVALIYSSSAGLTVATSADGLSFDGVGEYDDALREVLTPLGLGTVGVIVRETEAGTKRYFLRGLTPPESAVSEIYVAQPDGNGGYTLLNGSAPVYSGGPGDGQNAQVIDISELGQGILRMVYCSKEADLPGTREAWSFDEGLSWQFARDNVYGDLGMTKAQDVNVDPAMLRLQDGTFLSVTMRGAQLFVWNSADGFTFTQIEDFVIDASDFDHIVDDPKGLYDPTIVQLGDGTIMLYACAGDDAEGQVVAAKLSFND